MRRGLPLIVLVACAGLAGCSEEPNAPGTLPPLTASPSPSASPSAAPTPTGLDAPTPAGASAFARHWYTQVDLAYATKDPAPLRRLSAAGCDACERYIASITRLLERNESLSASAYMLKAVETPSMDDGAETVNVSVIYDSEGAVRYDSQGHVTGQEPPQRNAEETLVLIRDGARWKVGEVLAG